MTAVRLRDASLAYGSRVLWEGLSLDIEPGEFVAVLGPNGAGKTSLLRVLLGQQALSRGSVEVGGRPVQRGSAGIGYVPQQKNFDPGLPVRARDLVRFGIDGHRWGVGLRSRKRDALVDHALARVNATAYADVPIGLLSGGEQQRLRIAQALITEPDVLLCDEPLLSLDLSHQESVSALIDERRKATNTAVIFVTHSLDPIVDRVDRVLYIAAGRFRVGTVAEVITSEVLSELFGSPIQVLEVGGRLLVLGGETYPHHHEEH
ncbi:metal ABC transporter ATP-binding protein [Nakamurella antarctica]|uniref:Metal ABC transporter ATP-binding protein n=1 Tax=Nakamurella antarctica TaxID=1902245 RepID=A0A3G8ZQA6_9ACTN|nr:metal ABC transporter ATP-binding protein [Nakamurella antarctica]AZI58977.1 metal ABC transporter ATP-binding protein [Nakamurella antarctica]